MTHPVIWLVGGVILGVASAGWVEPPPPLPVLAALAVFLWWARRGQPGRLVLAGLCFGVGLVSTLPEGPVLRGRVTVQGVVAGAAQGRRADVILTRYATTGGEWTEASGRVRVRFREGAPGPGAPVLIHGMAIEPAGGALPGAPDPVRALRLVRVKTEIVGARHRVLGFVAPRREATDTTGMLRAVATGDRSEVPEATLRRLRRTGTAHLLAISGFHVGVLAGVVGGAVLALLRWAAVLRPIGLPQWPALVVGVAAAMGYAWAAGAPVSAQRAAGLLALGAVGRASGRGTETLALLGLVAVGVLIVDPSALATPSMQLSFGAVIGLIRVTPLITSRIPKDAGFVRKWATNGFAATLGATVGTMPAAAWWFQEVAPLSPLANLIALPWMGTVIVPLAALATWGPQPLVGLAVWLGDRAVEAMLWALAPMDVTPWTPAVGPMGAVALLSWLVWVRRPWLCAIIGLFAFQLRVLPVAEPVLTVLDVGQGDAALLEWPDGRRWLVDGGRSGGWVLQWLRRRGIRRIDVVIASHGDEDHAGGLVPVVQSLRVGELWFAEPEGLAELLVVAKSRGVALRHLPGEALHPRPGERWPNRNEGSLVVDAAGVRFAGDISRKVEAALVAQGMGPVPVLKVAHHGSATSSSAGWLDLTQPAVAVIGVGRGNWYGHPDDAVLRRLEARGVSVWRTDVDGTIEVRPHADRVGVRSFRAGHGWGPTVQIPWRPEALQGGAREAADRRAPAKKMASARSATTAEIP